MKIDDDMIINYIYLGMILICVVIIPFIKKIIRHIKYKKEIKQIKFDEFDTIEKIKKQDKRTREEMEYEAKVLEKVYKDTYSQSMEEANKYDNRNYYNNDKLDLKDIYNEYNAHQDAQEAVERAKRDLYNFKILDAVEVEEEDVKEGNSINALKENGHHFDFRLFKKWSRQIFGCIKSGSNEAMEIIKNFMTEELYDKLVTQRKKFERDGLEFITENLLIEKCSIYDYYKGISREEILILINATMVEYIINKKTNEIVRGDRYKEYNKNILMTFSRQNTKGDEGLIHNCPNCGAKVTKTELGKCGYCSTLLIPIRYNWTLTKFETM
ncbi:MAG: hypothetical protein IJN50_06985 [Clostridia bacterium]|nr:hypothetical protein [Clostridia bacterium]